MSREIETQVWQHSRARGTTKLVLLCVANDAANASRQALIDPDDIAAQCNVGTRHVYDQLYKLEEMHELEKLADRTYRVRRYTGDGPFADMELTLPEQPRGSIKQPERRAAVRASRPRQRRRAAQ